MSGVSDPIQRYINRVVTDSDGNFHDELIESDKGDWVYWEDVSHIGFLQEENELLSDISNQAKLVLLASLSDPETMQAALGRLSLACRAHYEWRATKIPKEQPK